LCSWRGSLRLAFVAALQFLPARQRAVLILREVLDWPAADVAAALDMTTAAVNSALQRARGRLGEAALSQDQIDEPTDPYQRGQIERYVAAFENADLAGLEKLLADDVILEMPPFLNWYVGRQAYIRFTARAFTLRGTSWRMVPVHANRQPALAAYTRAENSAYALHSLQVFTVTESGISRNTSFQDHNVLSYFGLPEEITGTEH
jgi:RNA polymerase sigma-70 factor (ECF subfamily)